jgi:hypothetical protein
VPYLKRSGHVPCYTMLNYLVGQNAYVIDYRCVPWRTEIDVPSGLTKLRSCPPASSASATFRCGQGKITLSGVGVVFLISTTECDTGMYLFRHGRESFLSQVHPGAMDEGRRKTEGRCPFSSVADRMPGHLGRIQPNTHSPRSSNPNSEVGVMDSPSPSHPAPKPLYPLRISLKLPYRLLVCCSRGHFTCLQSCPIIM